MMNCKGYGKKQLWYSQGTIPELAWRNCGKHEKLQSE
jgi:hypothetical protein